MKVDTETGQAHLVSTLNTSELKTVGQAYWDGIVPGPKENQAISLVLAPGVSVPVKEITEWPVLAGQASDDATKLAFDGQVTLEANTQPKVCTIQIDESAQATADVVLGEAPQWEAIKIPDAATAAKSFGRDAYSSNPDNWESVDNGFGWKLKANKDGSNSIVEMTDLDGRGAVGQTYWDVQNDDSNGHNVVAGTLAPHTMALVREVTVYAGVPQGMEQAVTDYAFRQAQHLEFNTQLGVWVVKVTKTVCPAGPMPITELNAAIARATAEIANPTARPTVRPTSKPDATPSPTGDWMLPYEQEVGDTRAHPLAEFTNGLKIENGAPVLITIYAGEKIDLPGVSHNGPWTGTVTTATIWKIK